MCASPPCVTHTTLLHTPLSHPYKRSAHTPTFTSPVQAQCTDYCSHISPIQDQYTYCATLMSPIQAHCTDRNTHVTHTKPMHIPLLSRYLYKPMARTAMLTSPIQAQCTDFYPHVTHSDRFPHVTHTSPVHISLPSR